MMQRGPAIFPDSRQVNLATEGEPPFIYSEDVSLAPPFYRYMKKEHYDEFARTGKWRLGTLHSYHDELRLGQEQGDSKEGFRAFHTSRDGEIPGAIPIVFYANAVNQWSLCTSRVRDERFYPCFKANCCISIDSLQFFREIAAAARHSTRLGSLLGVRYVDTIDLIHGVYTQIQAGEPIRLPFLPATKAARFGWQEEVRLLLEPPPRGNLRRYDDIDMETYTKWTDEMQTALLAGRDHDLLARPELHHDLAHLFVEAPSAVRYTRIVEER